MLTQSKIRKKYTRVYRRGERRWNTALVIDNQSFCVVDGTTYQCANWYAKMLSVALERMLQNEQSESEGKAGRQKRSASK